MHNLWTADYNAFPFAMTVSMGKSSVKLPLLDVLEEAAKPAFVELHHVRACSAFSDHIRAQASASIASHNKPPSVE
jgi:hypothetical protein